MQKVVEYKQFLDDILYNKDCTVDRWYLLYLVVTLYCQPVSSDSDYCISIKVWSIININLGFKVNHWKVEVASITWWRFCHDKTCNL